MIADDASDGKASQATENSDDFDEVVPSQYFDFRNNTSGYYAYRIIRVFQYLFAIAHGITVHLYIKQAKEI